MLSISLKRFCLSSLLNCTSIVRPTQGLDPVAFWQEDQFSATILHRAMFLSMACVHFCKQKRTHSNDGKGKCNYKESKHLVRTLTSENICTVWLFATVYSRCDSSVPAWRQIWGLTLLWQWCSTVHLDVMLIAECFKQHWLITFGWWPISICKLLGTWHALYYSLWKGPVAIPTIQLESEPVCAFHINSLCIPFSFTLKAFFLQLYVDLFYIYGFRAGP